MALDPASLPDDVDALKRLIVGLAREAVHASTLIEKLRGELARMKRARFGTSSEKFGPRLEQLELAIEALEVDEAERLAGTPVVAEALKVWTETSLAQVPGRSDLAKGLRYMLARWPALMRAFDDRRLALDNNAAERALRCVAVGRKNYLFVGSELGAERAAAFYTLIETAKMNGLDPEAYLRDVLTRIADHPAKRLADLLPWNWMPTSEAEQAA
ncbi:IS66 family transposase [Methylobacterium ajmalii]|uniref:IS66 family transposase n=1 Tax=Methylobacterium ajmalii TaxID=2738439 RepID=UPI001909A1F5|nr:transposase [Methylobacterium ajmalii]MBK3422823.1 transposase [Methylobacterium ajmalii]